MTPLTMKNNKVAIVALLAVPVVVGSSWALLPELQSDERAVQRRASVELERARRLLDRYIGNLQSVSLVSEQFTEDGIEIETDDLNDQTADDYQEIHSEFWSAYPPRDWRGDQVQPARANYGNVPNQIREGIADQVREAQDNENLLTQALDTVKRAMSITVGNASSRSYAEGARLKGAIHYQMGIAKLLEAALVRQREADNRQKLRTLGLRAARANGSRVILADIGLNEKISALEGRIAGKESAIEEKRRQLAPLEARIADLQARLSKAQEQRDRAMQGLNQLKTRGLDFSDPDASKSFASQFMALDRTFREAQREEKALRFGTYPEARIDWTGDYLTGRYLENGSPDVTVDYGLQHYVYQQSVLKTELSGEEKGLADMRSGLDRMRATREEYIADTRKARQIVEQTTTNAREVYAELNREDSEASVIEDDALQLFDQSSRSFKQASGFSARWIREAREKTQQLNPEAKERSAYNARLRDEWMGGFALAQQADALLASASIHYARYQAHRSNAGVLGLLKKLLNMAEADPKVEQTKAEQDGQAGTELVTQAMDSLQQAHRQVGKNWTITAQAAGATYMLALLGNPDYVKDAIQAYRTAIEGREKEEFAAVFAERLRRLEARAGS